MTKTVERKTDILLERLDQITNIETLKAYINDLDQQEIHIRACDFLNHMLSTSPLSRSDLIKNAEIDRTYGYQILQGKRIPGRNKLIALCLVMQLTLKQTQYALTINGNNILYAKHKRDAIIIFSINRKLSVIQTNDLLFESGVETLQSN